MMDKINVTLVKEQHEQRLRSEIYSQWMLRVYGISVSMEDKERRVEGRMEKKYSMVKGELF